jgi:hypothetical protein
MCLGLICDWCNINLHGLMCSAKFGFYIFIKDDIFLIGSPLALADPYVAMYADSGILRLLFL